MPWLFTKQKNLKLILFILLIIILFIIYYYKSTPSLTTHQLKRNKQNINSEYIKIQSFTSQIHSLDSKNTHYVLTSPSLLINKKTNIAYLSKPKILIYSNNQLSWTITAHQGLINFIPNDWSNIKKIKLITQVKVLQLLGANPITILSEHLEIYPSSNLVISNEKVTLNQNKLKTTGIGLQANLKKHSMALLNNVYTHYLLN